MVGKNNKLDRLEQELIITNLGESQISTESGPWNAKLYVIPSGDHHSGNYITVLWHKDISTTGWPAGKHEGGDWGGWYGWNIRGEIEIKELKDMISPRLDHDIMELILKTIRKYRGQ
jgi:hypothetical protein